MEICSLWKKSVQRAAISNTGKIKQITLDNNTKEEQTGSLHLHLGIRLAK
jgi:hypothetical protein